jgi:nucleotide-binding universal stress UspA family protein
LFQAPPHKWLLLAVGWELFLLGVLIQFPIVRETFGIRVPTWPDLALVLTVSALVVAVIEITKVYLKASEGGLVAGRSRFIDMKLLKLYVWKTVANGMGKGQALLLDKPAAGFVQQRASHASVSRRIIGGNTMLRVLIPVDGSRNCQFAVKHVIRQFMNNTAMEIHLLNVQPLFSSYIARFVGRKALHDYRRDQAEKMLRPIRQMLDGFGIPYSAHAEAGDRATCIADTARRLRCDQIVMSTARKNSLTRLVENSVTNRLLELASVPVEVIAGDAVSRWERYGIPAALTALLAVLVATAAD